MQKQRPPRGQAWPWVRSLPWVRRLQLSLFGNLSVFIYWVHLIVIWQCPSGTEFGDNIVQFNLFSVHSVLQRISGLGQENTLDFGSSVWTFCGDEPHKNCSQNFLNFWKKIPCPKKLKIIFSILGQKTMQIDVIWSQGYGKIVFLIKIKF